MKQTKKAKKNKVYAVRIKIKRSRCLLKKLPQRKCIGWNISKNKNELIRVVKNKDNEINIDKTGKLPGRGAYLCNNKDCLEKAIKNHKLEKTFEMKIENDIYDKLRGVMIDE